MGVTKAMTRHLAIFTTCPWNCRGKRPEPLSLLRASLWRKGLRLHTSGTSISSSSSSSPG